MNAELVEKLITDTALEDVPETYRDIAELIGVENLIRLAQYANGNMLYVPKVDNLLAAARNRCICAEYDGYNVQDICKRYDLTPRQVSNILKDMPTIGQLDLADCFPCIVQNL